MVPKWALRISVTVPTAQLCLVLLGVSTALGGQCPGVVNPADEKSGGHRWAQPSVLGSAQVFLILQRRN